MTHLNAYIQEVEEKRIALARAQSAFDQAVADLQAKEDELNPPTPEQEPELELEAEPEDKGKEAKYR